MTPSWKTAPPETLRTHHLADAIAQEGPLPDSLSVRAAEPDGGFRGGLWLTPGGVTTDGGVIVYFHGGGFVAGSPRTHRALAAWLGQLSGLPVLSAAYRLAPESPAPAQQQDALAAFAHALASCPPSAPLFLAGDSAGAAIALWATMALDAATRERLEGVLLFYGAFGLLETDSIAALGTDENALDAEAIAISYERLGFARGDIAGSALDPFRPDVGLPTRSYLLVGDRDPLLDDTRALARHLEAEGKTAELRVVAGAEHSFLKPAGRDPIANEELKRAATWIAARRQARNS